MNRSSYFNYIDEKLHFLAYRIKSKGKINLLDLNIYSETFFADMVNILLEYQFQNLNFVKQNSESIDLVDSKNKIIAQVTSTCNKRKIESSLEKEILTKYPNYRFKFIFISDNADKLRKGTFANPHNILFDSSFDIIDIGSILKIILYMNIDKQKEMYEFIKKELGSEIDIVKVDSNLATILNILAKDNLVEVNKFPEINSFEINQKIGFNNLFEVQDLIDDYKIFYSKLNEKYEEFDKQGANKSLSIFTKIKKEYSRLLATGKESDELFYAIIDSVIDIIKTSKNYIEIPFEELEMGVNILIVDTFIRCKIFNNPKGYNHVITR